MAFTVVKTKRVAAEKENRERWLLTYADMITLLLALFVVLFATGQIDQVKFTEIAASFQRAFHVPVKSSAATRSVIEIGPQRNALPGLSSMGQNIGTQLLSYAQREGVGDQVSITASNDAVVITLTGALPFPPGSAELRADALEALEIVAEAVRALPENNPIRIDGHTDSMPTSSGRFPTNWDLSAARAATVARILAEQGIEPERLSAFGYAETRPIAENDTPEGRTRNRRVEIWILPAQPVGPIGPPTPAAGAASPAASGLGPAPAGTSGAQAGLPVGSSSGLAPISIAPRLPGSR